MLVAVIGILATTVLAAIRYHIDCGTFGNKDLTLARIKNHGVGGRIQSCYSSNDSVINIRYNCNCARVIIGHEYLTFIRIIGETRRGGVPTVKVVSTLFVLSDIIAMEPES